MSNLACPYKRPSCSSTLTIRELDPKQPHAQRPSCLCLRPNSTLAGYAGDCEAPQRYHVRQAGIQSIPVQHCCSFGPKSVKCQPQCVPTKYQKGSHLKTLARKKTVVSTTSVMASGRSVFSRPIIQHRQHLPSRPAPRRQAFYQAPMQATERPPAGQSPWCHSSLLSAKIQECHPPSDATKYVKWSPFPKFGKQDRTMLGA